MEASIAIFFGSTTGSTQMVAEKIRDLLGERLSHLADVNTAEASELEQYDVIFFGVPTWNVGEMQDDWADFIPNMSELNLAGKKVAFFGGRLGIFLGTPSSAYKSSILSCKRWMDSFSFGSYRLK